MGKLCCPRWASRESKESRTSFNGTFISAVGCKQGGSWSPRSEGAGSKVFEHGNTPVSPITTEGVGCFSESNARVVIKDQGKPTQKMCLGLCE